MQQRRAFRDRFARRVIGLGGLAVIAAITLLFFYLVYIVVPLFRPASSSLEDAGRLVRAGEAAPLVLAVEEQREIGLRVAPGGMLEFFRIADGTSLLRRALVPEGAGGLTAAAAAIEQNGLVAVAAADGAVVVFRHEYETRFEGGIAGRSIEPRLTFPWGEGALLQLRDGPARALALSENDDGLALAALDATGRIEVLIAGRGENLLTGEVSVDSRRFGAGGFADATAITVSGDHAWLYAGDARGGLRRLPLAGLQPAEPVAGPGQRVTALTMLPGGVSLLAGDASGRVTQLFPVPDDTGAKRLRAIRTFQAPAAVREIVIEPRRRGFLVLDEENRVTLFHTTSGRLLHQRSLADLDPRAVALSPRADALLIEGRDGALHELAIRNEHPEVSFASLWRKVWYENYDQPDFVWQSSAATRDFEPKFSLTPLVFGTVKAALYAMLFAVPLALMGAAHTACFMAPRLKRLVKPGIEIIAALPTVILGFLAGLWFAPFVERHLAALFALVLIVPSGLLLSGWLWQLYGGPLRRFVPDGFESLLLMPVLVLCVLLAFAIAEPLQYALFGQDLRTWLTGVAGIDYDQRNALVVGCAMGFAVIPTIFTIAEDAMAGVPASLSGGSLALGATNWQTLLFVILPTASPGIFSALMIGFGRAVGETMIVLMASGNTPVMDWSVFDGMRTLAANLAIELPESAVGSTHYRLLFLAALVLFVFTFAVNTVADLIRQRLRDRYGSL